MTKTIKKSVVIQALKKENLAPGSFFDGKKGSEDCTVCAVGAVLRAVSFEAWAERNGLLGDIGNVACNGDVMGEEIKWLLKEKNYMGALSCYFEDEVCYGTFGEVTPAQRKKTIAFVKKYFPKEFELTINK